MAAILLIDGDRNFREALAIALRLEGATVVSVASAAEALATLLAEAPFALVAVDSLLPHVEELLEALSLGAAQVVVTGPHRELLERAAARHHLPMLEKPFAPEALQRLRRPTAPGWPRPGR